ncbi:MAG: protocatechuate 3,4-dioxygenase subunit alpha [Pseudomonadota bacterium]
MTHPAKTVAAAPHLNRPAPTCEDTVGPYYPLPFLDSDRMDLTVVHPGLSIRPEGTPIELRGTVRDIHGALATGVLLEFWQADAAGRFRGPETLAEVDSHFEGFARCRVEGAFTLRTIKPGPVSAADGAMARAPHITLTIFSDGISRLVTQIFFADEVNEGDPVFDAVPAPRRDRLLAAPTGEVTDGAQVYAIAIQLAGEDETPFFDDLPDGVA